MKSHKILIIILCSLFIVGTPFVNAYYTVTVGETYDVVESKWDYAVDSDDSEGFGFNFNDLFFFNNKDITVTVNYEEGYRVEFTTTVEDESIDLVITPMITIGIGLLLSYPSLLVQGLEHSIQTGAADNGLPLQHIYFIEPTLSAQFFTMMSDDAYIASEYTNGESWTYNSIGGIFDTDSDIAVFTWYYNTRYTVWTDDTDFSGTYTFEIEYDQNTGILQKYRMDCEYGGIWGYTNVKLEFHQEIALRNNSNAGFSSLTLFAIIPIFASILLFQQTKRKKNE
ncbi:MAG: hypothetical protein JXA54_15705 [Candidatus Heimdallarchaeota archaeon]|nr:hypothetical protein [Candidatus Heimdallarchaeota archaeon]